MYMYINIHIYICQVGHHWRGGGLLHVQLVKCLNLPSGNGAASGRNDAFCCFVAGRASEVQEACADLSSPPRPDRCVYMCRADRYICIYIHVCVCVYMYLYEYVHIYMCVYIYGYMDMYACIYVYIYIICIYIDREIDRWIDTSCNKLHTTKTYTTRCGARVGVGWSTTQKNSLRPIYIDM